jgi:hypothetical protein
MDPPPPPQPQKIVIINPDESANLGTEYITQRERLRTLYKPRIEHLQERIATFDRISKHHTQRIKDNIDRVHRARAALQNPNITPAQMMSQNSAIMEFENNIYDANQSNMQALTKFTEFSNQLNEIQAMIDQAPNV